MSVNRFCEDPKDKVLAPLCSYVLQATLTPNDSPLHWNMGIDLGNCGNSSVRPCGPICSCGKIARILVSVVGHKPIYCGSIPPPSMAALPPPERRPFSVASLLCGRYILAIGCANALQQTDDCHRGETPVTSKISWGQLPTE